jgi:ubiquinone/menaquinone biosynthesis C-methylase UbiE
VRFLIARLRAWYIIAGILNTMAMPGALYDRIGSAYDATRCADSYIVGRLLAQLDPVSQGHYIDVACGTGNYSWALAAAGLSVTGVDASRRMITAAAQKELRPALRRDAPAAWTPHPQWVVGDVTRLPFERGAFDGATCMLGLKYFVDLEAAIRELARVINRGRLVIFAATPEQIRRYWLRAYFPRMVGRVAAQAYHLERITVALETAGFGNVRTEPYDVRRDVEDLFLYSGKHRPELYLNPAVRAGMWSFATLATPEEEATGCAALRRDLYSGRVQAVMQDSASGESSPGGLAGDYTFVVADRVR